MNWASKAYCQTAEGKEAPCGQSAGVMLGMRAVVLQPGGRGGVEEREETPQCPARAQVSLEVTQRM